MGFVTKIDYSNNRQIRQFVLTNTALSGTTTFGVPFNDLPSGVNLDTVVTTSILTGITSTFSGNTSETQIAFGDSRMGVGASGLEILTSLTSGTTQVTTGFEGNSTIEVDGNLVNLSYTGCSFDFTVTSMEEVGFNTWTGTAYSELVTFLSGGTLDFTERPIWVDVKGIIRTNKLILNNKPPKNNNISSVLGRQTDGDVVEVDLTQLDTVYQGTYAELQVLIDTNELIVGNKYILNDYKTIYQIGYSNTDDIIERHRINGNSGGYAFFSSGISSSSLKNGDVVRIDSLPIGYSGTKFVGQAFTVSDFFNSSYILFSPQLNETGIVIRINNQRYPNVTSASTILDIYGNVIMKPGGVLNTSVHNDLVYMNMSAIENPSPKVEELILTAIGTNQFSIEAESLTYKGDRLLYYFDNKTIIDENGNVIGTRNGLVQKRDAFNLGISVNKDWRVQRYRRWKMEDVDWSGFTLQQDLYKVNNTNICTTVNNTIGDAHKYILISPYNKNFYIDFYSSAITNPFLSGTTSAPSVDAAQRLGNDLAPEYSKTITISLSGLTSAKDIHIFPILNEKPTSLVSSFKVPILSNSIFQTNSQRYGSSGSISVDMLGGIYNSSFMTGLTIVGAQSASLVEVRGIDACSLSISDDASISKVNLLSFGNIEMGGIFYNTTFGSSRSGTNDYTSMRFDGTTHVRNSIFGGIRTDYMKFEDLQCNKFLCMIWYGGANRISGNIYLTQLQTTANVWGADINLKTYVNRNPKTNRFGYYYSVVGEILNDLYVDNYNGQRDLVHVSSDSLNVISWVTKAILQ
jgi:hypothetical protein